MSKPLVLVTRRIPSSALTRLEAACDVELYDRGDLPHDELLKRIVGKQGLVSVVTDAIDRAVLDAGTDLRVISTIAVGYNNIDVPAARERGVVVTNTPDVLTESTADLTWALILGITRRIVEGDRLVRRGQWKGFTLDFMLGSDLRGKQLGIVGLGRIGKAVAARAPAFGMRLAYTGRSAQSGVAGEFMPLDRLLSTSDVVSLHCPLTPETKHLINQTTLMRMKRSAYLISAARGPIVDEAALVWALENRILAGAALDVYEREPEIQKGLLSLENVVLSPHLGSSAIETRTTMIQLAVQNVVAVLSGEPPLTPIA
ncbi:MAG TPA: D-glycerate dehydrogenase [Vicinamibacterales bacterium]|nr:D-glycerate dehydrogenase [Vicinamibacterales bacterium]